LKVETAIAKVGHDAGSVKASTAAYNKLPGCCKYRK
jgi:Cu(I)/Ag(I) efflux system membrane fusion protein